ncbi:MAG: cyclic nucleotide-binding domain-containing protein [bacterium]|nr:cyclic nucleotide-binding domain-containing protein [bacterium]
MVSIRKDIFLRLKSEIQFFHDFSEEEMLAFLRLMQAEHVPLGKIVFREYDQGDKMYILFSGGIDITKRVNRHEGTVHETVIAKLIPGDCFGELGLIDHRPRSATARATANSLVFSISTEKLEKISRNPKYAFLSYRLFRNFANVLAGRLRDTNQKVVDLEAQRIN